MRNVSKRNKKKMETSKLFCGVIVFFSMACVCLCFVLAFMGNANPLESLGSTIFLGGVVGECAYLLYNGKLKDSRNKHGIDADGIPFSMKSYGRDEENEH